MIQQKILPIVWISFTVVLLFLLSGCNYFYDLSASLMPLNTPSPKLTPLPEKTPPPVRIWNESTINTICLDTNLTFSQVEGPYPDSVGVSVRNILTDMGLKVVDPGASCDATLSLKTSFKAFSALYNPGGTCYTGGSVSVQILLAAKGQESFSSVINEKKNPGETVLVSDCLDSRQPEDYDFTGLWTEPIVVTLVDLWGPQSLVYMLGTIDTGHWPTMVSKKLKEIEPEDEVILALIYAMQAENSELRKNAVRMARDFAPEAEEAIPYLAQATKDDEEEVRNEAYRALKVFGPLAVPQLIELLPTSGDQADNIPYWTLKYITGQDFGMDVQRWQKWWDKGQ